MKETAESYPGRTLSVPAHPVHSWGYDLVGGWSGNSGYFLLQRTSSHWGSSGSQSHRDDFLQSHTLAEEKQNHTWRRYSYTRGHPYTLQSLLLDMQVCFLLPWATGSFVPGPLDTVLITFTSMVLSPQWSCEGSISSPFHRWWNGDCRVSKLMRPAGGAVPGVFGSSLWVVQDPAPCDSDREAWGSVGFNSLYLWKMATLPAISFPCISIIIGRSK